MYRSSEIPFGFEVLRFSSGRLGTYPDKSVNTPCRVSSSSWVSGSLISKAPTGPVTVPLLELETVAYSATLIK